MPGTETMRVDGFESSGSRAGDPSTGDGTGTPVEIGNERPREVLYEATRLFNQGTDWLSFFRRILGVQGVARRLFATQEEFRAFEQTEAFAQIERLLYSLRAQKFNPRPNHEPTKVITVRLPESLHEALRAEAADHSTSVNKLCISKLLQALNDEVVPVPLDKGRSQPAAARDPGEAGLADSEMGRQVGL